MVKSRNDKSVKQHTIITKTGHKTIKITRAKAIRQKCLECCGWFTPEVRECTCEDCALWPYRMGTGFQSSARIYGKSGVSQDKNESEYQTITQEKTAKIKPKKVPSTENVPLSTLG